MVCVKDKVCLGFAHLGLATGEKSHIVASNKQNIRSQGTLSPLGHEEHAATKGRDRRMLMTTLLPRGRITMYLCCLRVKQRLENVNRLRRHPVPEGHAAPLVRQ